MSAMSDESEEKGFASAAASSSSFSASPSSSAGPWAISDRNRSFGVASTSAGASSSSSSPPLAGDSVTITSVLLLFLDRHTSLGTERDRWASAHSSHDMGTTAVVNVFQYLRDRHGEAVEAYWADGTEPPLAKLRTSIGNLLDEQTDPAVPLLTKAMLSKLLSDFQSQPPWDNVVHDAYVFHSRPPKGCPLWYPSVGEKMPIDRFTAERHQPFALLLSDPADVELLTQNETQEEAPELPDNTTEEQEQREQQVESELQHEAESVLDDLAVSSPPPDVQSLATFLAAANNSSRLFQPTQEALARRILDTFAVKFGDKWKQFTAVDFRIFVPIFNQLVLQTADRVHQCGLMEENPRNDGVDRLKTVWSYHQKNAKTPLISLKEQVKRSPSTLFLLIADECEYGATPGKGNNDLVNDPLLWEADNVVVLLVSATPHALLSTKSRVPLRVEPIGINSRAPRGHACRTSKWANICPAQGHLTSTSFPRSPPPALLPRQGCCSLSRISSTGLRSHSSATRCRLCCADTITCCWSLANGGWSWPQEKRTHSATRRS